MYETQAVLSAVDRNSAAVLTLCSLALIGNYILWIENLRLGFRDRRFSMPVACVLFFLAHDASFVAMAPHWFGNLHHWFPQLWWFGLCVTVVMELVFHVMLLRFGRQELAPDASQATFTAVILLGLAMTVIGWLVLKSVMQDELFLTIFGITVFWCTFFNFSLMARRKSAVGQSTLAWLGFLMMPTFYWPATWLLSPGFHTLLWNALGAATFVGGVVNLVYLRSLNRAEAFAAVAD